MGTYWDQSIDRGHGYNNWGQQLVGFSLDGARMTSTSYSGYWLAEWTIPAGTITRYLPSGVSEDGVAQALAITSDGSYLLASYTQRIQLWLANSDDFSKRYSPSADYNHLGQTWKEGMLLDEIFEAPGFNAFFYKDTIIFGARGGVICQTSAYSERDSRSQA